MCGETRIERGLAALKRRKTYGVGMAYAIEALRALSDDQLIADHDEKAKFTTVGTDYFMDELDRRSRERALEAANRLARRSFWMTVASTVLSLVATAVAVVALVLA